MIELEKEIMASFLAYPQQIDEFLDQIPKEYFTQKGQRTLEILIELLES